MYILLLLLLKTGESGKWEVPELGFIVLFTDWRPYHNSNSSLDSILLLLLFFMDKVSARTVEKCHNCTVAPELL